MAAFDFQNERDEQLQGLQVTPNTVTDVFGHACTLCPIDGVDSSVAMFMKDNFDTDGQLDSIAPLARSIQTSRQGRNYLEFCQNFHELKDGTVHTLDSTQCNCLHCRRSPLPSWAYSSFWRSRRTAF